MTKTLYLFDINGKKIPIGYYEVASASLSVGGSWTNVQHANTVPDPTGLTFTCTYSDGTTSNVNATLISPAVWSDNAVTQTATFSYVVDGVTVTATKDVPVVKPVGGKIFYIDSTATGTYTFYDDQETLTSAPTVGTDCTGWFYSIDDLVTKDKYYVYNDNAMFKCAIYGSSYNGDRTGSLTCPYLSWTYLDATNQSYISNTTYTSGKPSNKQEYEYYGSKGRVYESLSTITGTAIGTGKSNTNKMMALRGGVYVQGIQIAESGSSKYSETIWHICNQFNNGTYIYNASLVANNTGCSDWYIPSIDELIAMKNSIGASAFAAKLITGNSSSQDITPYSSSADSTVNKAYVWYIHYGSDWGSYTYSRVGNYYNYCLALCRSF